MKKIITALGNNNLNEALKNTGNYEIVTKDIFYKEGVLEVLEEFPNIDTIIISELLEGEISFEKLIEEIKTIKEDIDVIVFVKSKTTELQSFLFKNGIYKIYENNEIELERFIESLQDKSTQEPKENIVDRLMKKSKIFEATGKIIAITGSYNSGKSSITCLLAREYAKQGETRETDFFNIIAWNKLAETASKYLKKGMQILITGRLQTRYWDDEQGQRHYVTEIIAEELDFADSKKDDNENTINYESLYANGNFGNNENAKEKTEDKNDDFPF